MSGNIRLKSNSKFCGVDNNETSCNAKPERFVLASSAGPDGLSCDANIHVLSFGPGTLPHAIVHMRKGTVKPTTDDDGTENELHGIVWAQNICTSDGNLTLKSIDDSSMSVVREANTLWKWEEKGFPGYGQMVVRGIRGTGLDTFRRW